MKPTIRDVARCAGVSVGSTSNVFNGRKVGPTIQQRVMEAAELLGYTPHAIARKLASQKTGAVGLFVINDEEEMFHHALWGFLIPEVRGILQVCELHDHELLLNFSTLSKIKKNDLFNQIVKAHSLDGLFVCLRVPLEYELVSEIVRHRFPAVFVNGEVPGLHIPSVRTDNCAGARHTVEYLIGLGHRRIAMITGPASFLDVQDRISGYREALDCHGIACNPSLVREGDFLFDSGYRWAAELLDLPCPPTAIFCANDDRAAGAIRACKERGCAVPQDISVAGFDDQIIAEVCDPGLTTTRPPLHQLGALAAQRLFQIVDRPGEEAHCSLLEPELIVRESCAPPARASCSQGRAISRADKERPDIPHRVTHAIVQGPKRYKEVSVFSGSDPQRLRGDTT